MSLNNQSTDLVPQSINEVPNQTSKPLNQVLQKHQELEKELQLPKEYVCIEDQDNERIIIDCTPERNDLYSKLTNICRENHPKLNIYVNTNFSKVIK